MFGPEVLVQLLPVVLAPMGALVLLLVGLRLVESIR